MQVSPYSIDGLLLPLVLISSAWPKQLASSYLYLL